MVRGRKPKATAVKEASGALRKNPQRRNHEEPQPRLGWPAMPSTVAADEAASAAWSAVCGILEEMKILAVSDVHAIAMYCTTYAEWSKAYEHVRKHGVSCPTAAGGVTTSPETHQYNKLSDRLLKMFAELGMTPSSRSRIRVQGDAEEDNPITDLLARFQGIN